jgi:hypothetical protein
MTDAQKHLNGHEGVDEDIFVTATRVDPRLMI